MSRLTSIEHHKPKRKGTQIVFWGLVGLMAVGLGGFGVTNFGGGVQRIGSVGERPITVQEYGRALQQEIRALGAQMNRTVSLQEAQAMGLDRQVRGRLVTEAALANEAARMGLSVGDARVAREITEIPSFQGPGGQFERETYRMVLQQNDLSEKEFETGLREELARSLLKGAVAGGFEAPAPVLDRLQGYISERRAFSVLRLTEDSLTAPLPAPTEEALKAWHEAHPADFTAPEIKRISYAALLPDDLAPTLPADEEALRRLYDDRRAEFVQPERRLVERLVFPSTEAAAEARRQLDAGASFESLVEARGLELQDIDLGDVSRDELGPAAEPVFALEEPGVVGPVETSLGPALFRMNGVFAAQETSFEEAREALLAESQQDAARRAILARRGEIDDLLAAGATIEELGADAGMTVATLEHGPGIDSALSGYPAFREAADALAEGDFPETVELEDGGLVALRLDEVVPPRLKPFDEVRAEVEAAARADQLAQALRERADEIAAAVAGGADLAGFGAVESLEPMTREGFVENVPRAAVEEAFTLEAGGTRAVSDAETVVVLRLDRIEPAPADDEAARALKAALAAQIEQALSQDALALFSNALMSEAGIALDDAAIAAVHAQFR